ncbi:hypothetical protein HOK51_04065 [Candidatus Woesearchaeota archaeon]|jgi:hypothetical protein|nr:hypothetical protein [Candidatus Woesearchaeota archaeon]MBT6518997.1 hypothetical protein [Candidatus Woesearchaeota archaeon]MBT7368804.1 hypothetical protein [Candidatus Woesearchaeota archaeon]
MEPKTKTKTDDGSRPYSGETQVRELSDVLSNDHVIDIEVDQQVRLAEFEKLYLDNDYVKLFDNEPLVNTLKEIITDAGYIKQDNKSGLDMYVKFAEDQSVEVITLANISKIISGNVEKGFAYAKFDNNNGLKKYEETLISLKEYKTKTGPELPAYILGTGFGVWMGASTYLNFNSISVSIVAGGMGLLLGLIGGVQLKMLKNKIIGDKKKDKLIDEFKKYQKNADYDRVAIRSALYQKKSKK